MIRSRLSIALSALCLAAPLATARAQDADTAPAWQFLADYKAEGWSNTRGGVDTGERYVDLLTLALAVDGQRAFGWTGAQFNVSGIANFGRSISALSGEAQAISNIDTGNVRSVWLYEAWYDQAFATGTSIRLGVQELNAEFDFGDAKALFLNAAHGMTTDIAQAGQAGPSTYPYTSLGARLKQTIGEHGYVQAMVMDGAPGDPAFPKRTAFKLRGSDGALVVAEAGYQADGRKYYLGAWTYTARFTDQATGLDHRGNHGLYAHIENPLADRLAGFVRIGVANGDFNPFTSYWGGGLVYTGLARDDDQLGLAIAHARTGEAYRQAVGGADKAETNFELTYRIQPCDWLSVQPDVQYVLNPNADPALRDALVVGLRLNLALTYPR